MLFREKTSMSECMDIYTENVNMIVDILTLKVPNKNCSRRHLNFLLLSFEENKA